MENEETEIEQKQETKAATPANDTPQVPGPDTKAFNEIKDRLDRLEAKGNRPLITGPANPAMGAEEVKSFTHYLSTGEKKSLTTADDTTNHILAPEEVSAEFIRNLVEFSPIRAIADVRTTGAPEVIMPKRTGVTNAVWVGETDARTGSKPTFDQSKIAIKELATFTDISLQLAEDSANVLSEVNLALAEDFGQKESLSFVSGSTALEPAGFMADANIAATDATGAAAIDPDELIAMFYAMPATYRNAGTWVMNGKTLSEIRKLKDGHNNYLWQPSYQAGQPERSLAAPWSKPSICRILPLRPSRSSLATSSAAIASMTACRWRCWQTRSRSAPVASCAIMPAAAPAQACAPRGVPQAENGRITGHA